MRTKSQPAGRSAFRRTPLVAAIACAFAQGAAGAIITVTNDLDSGAGSLRAAIDQANTECNVSGDLAPVIRFSGPFVIRPSSQLPSFQCFSLSPYTPSIDGLTGVAGASANTDPIGFNANLPVVLDGSLDFSGASCALNWNSFYGGLLSVRGLEIRNFSYGGFERPVCGPVYLSANRIVNNAQGVYAWGGSTIGDADPGDRNVIADIASGSAILLDGGSQFIVNNFLGTRDGVTFNGVSSGIDGQCCSTVSGAISGNVIVSTSSGISLWGDDVMTISGNMIGTDVTGTQALSPSGVGISLYYSYGASISDNVIAGQNMAITIYNGGYVGNFGYGDVFSAANGVTISNNKIGTDKGGGAVLGNSGEGVYDSWSYGTKITGGNVISGNGGTAVYLQGSTDAEVSGNFIGVNAGGGGTTFGNGGPGVYAGALQGGSLSITGNIISGNSGPGVELSDASDASIVGNYIGTDGSGLNAIPNQSDGLALGCGERLTVEDNVLSGNTSDGIELSGILNSSFRRNKIGVGVNGFSPLPNDGDGIDMSDADCGNAQAAQAKEQRAKAAQAKSLFGYYTTSGNTFESNVVSGNTGDGVRIGSGSNNYFGLNTIRANLAHGITVEDGVGNNFGYDNSIHGNGVKNVDLGFYGGPLVNDPGDPDGSPPDIPRPNNWQNKPEIKTAVRNPSASETVVTFELDSQPGTFNVDLYSNPAPGKAAGAKWLARTQVVIASGPASGQFNLDGIGEDYFSAIATRTDVTDSSEFAELFAATTVATPGVTVLPTSINFFDVVVGRRSADSTITVTSEGTAPYVINALRDSSCTGAPICSTGAFTCSTSCLEATPYSKGISCTIMASFAPTALGSQTHTLALCDNAAGSPRTLTFTGNGVPTPEVDIAMAPSSWSFGEVLVGAQSTPKSFTVANAGAALVYLSNVRVLGDFVLSGNTCGPTLAAGASCSADVTFVPAGKGITTGAIEVTGSNTPPSPAAALRGKVTGPTTTTVSATVQGIGMQFGDLRLPASLSFGTLVLNSSPGRQTVPISNFGNGPLTVNSMSVSGPFTMTNDCGPSLAPGAGCTIALDFNPNALGTFNGTLTVISDAPGGSRAIALSAQVIADARPVVRVNPTSVGFGERVIGSQSPTQRVTVTNEGAESAILGAFTFVQPEEGPNAQGKTEFSLAGTNCTGTLAPQATCFADVIMKPLGFGGRTGQMVVPSNSADSPRVVTLGGTGCRPFAAGANRSGRDPCAP